MYYQKYTVRNFICNIMSGSVNAMKKCEVGEDIENGTGWEVRIALLDRSGRAVWLDDI